MFRRLHDQNHYQVLEVSYDASSDEIQSAYEVARDIYSHDALVSGSILSDHERRRTFDRISEAYQTLIAEESRRLYDQRLGLAEVSNRAVVREAVAVCEPAHAVNDHARSDRAAVDHDVNKKSVEREQVDTDHASEVALATARPEPRKCPIELKPSEEASGEFLRKAREAMGLELATISEETKIGRSMLEYIETERLDRLPAAVYLKNFTRQVARCLGLDEDRVSTTYLARIRRRSSN